MAICMKVMAGHIHDVECDRKASQRAAHKGRDTTQIGIRIPDEDAVKLRELAARYESVNDFMLHLIRTQALHTR